jgi:hypothetical protein
MALLRLAEFLPLLYISAKGHFVAPGMAAGVEAKRRWISFLTFIFPCPLFSFSS